MREFLKNRKTTVTTLCNLLRMHIFSSNMYINHL